MRFNDAIIGMSLAIIAIMVLFHVKVFPSLPLHDVGPATFPRALAWVLLICSAYLVFDGIRTRTKDPAVSFGSWAHSPQAWRRLALVPIAVLTYTFAAAPVGFIPTTMLVLFVLIMDFSNGRWVVAATISLIFTVGIYLVFAHILLVPLPPGILVSIFL